MKPKICILQVEGTNCEYETFLAFTRLGAAAEIVHLKQLIEAEEVGAKAEEREQRRLKDYDALVIPGGFSSGDYIRAGAILAARVNAALGDEIADFIKMGAGKPVLGICNGFQVLVEMGLLPGFESVSLTTNDSARFECRPVLIRQENNGKCIFTQSIEKGRVLKMPCAHAEGKFFIDAKNSARYIQLLEDNDQIVFRYVDPDGDYASYPWNPNGSVYNIAGICNPEGTILGLMPHPERAFYAFTDSEWSRIRIRTGKSRMMEYGDGKKIFESVLNYLRKSVF